MHIITISREFGSGGRELGKRLADLLECDIDRIPEAARWGVKLLNPVWNRANVLSGTNAEDKERGLSEKGRDFIRALESSAIYADVSHLSDAGLSSMPAMPPARASQPSKSPPIQRVLSPPKFKKCSTWATRASMLPAPTKSR